MSERDPELEKLYREHSREEPSSAIDAKILAAAHRAVESGPRKVGAEATRPQRWWMPLAAAAAIGVVAIGVIQQMPKETAIDATSVATAPELPAAVEENKPAPVDADALAKKQKEAVASAPPPPPPPPRAATVPAPEPARAPKVTADKASPAQESGRDSKLAAQVAPTPFPASEEKRKTEAEPDLAKRDAPMEQSFQDRRKDNMMREERQAAAPAAAGAAPAAPPPPAAAPAPAPAPAPAAPSQLTNRMRVQSETAAGAIGQSKNVEDEMRTLARDPDAWIVRIRKLRDEGNTAQALRELKEFRALVPDAERRLPADLRALQP